MSAELEKILESVATEMVTCGYLAEMKEVIKSRLLPLLLAGQALSDCGECDKCGMAWDAAKQKALEP